MFGRVVNSRMFCDWATGEQTCSLLITTSRGYAPTWTSTTLRSRKGDGQTAGLSRDHGIPQQAELLNFYLDDVAGLQKYRRRAEYADAFWSAGGNNIAGFERDAGRNKLNQCSDAEDHSRSVGVLKSGAVYASGYG
jgi:hypothetical protein